MKTLFILSEPACGNERSYNGLRLALSLAKTGETEVRMFLMGDAVTCALAGQKTPEGYYNLERMLKGCSAKGVDSPAAAAASTPAVSPRRCSRARPAALPSPS